KVGPVDVYANGELISNNLAFGKYTAYFTLNSGNYEIQLYPAGLYDKPIFTKAVTLLPRSASTISVITLNDGIDLFVLNDSTGNVSITNSFLRFINLSPTSPLLTLTLSNNSPLFSNVEYVETTGYYPLSPGIYNLRVVISSAQSISKFISELRLVNGQFNTIYVIGLFNDTPKLGYLVLTDGR
ncbi:MAG: DUF4397 domain-containing protein, partial [Clostridium sp.]